MKAGLLIATLMVVAHLGSITRSALADVDVAYQPAPRTVDRGVLFDLQLVVTSDSAVDQSISAMDIVLTWEPAALEFIGIVRDSPYEWLMTAFLPDALNDSLDDGDAKFTALSNFNEPAFAPPGGLLVATFQFRALIDTDLTTVHIVPTTPMVTATQIFGAEVANQIITGALEDAPITTAPPSDCNMDGVFDLRELHRMQTCFTGAVGPSATAAYPSDPALCCTVFDHDDDGDIDWADYGFLTGLLGEPVQ